MSVNKKIFFSSFKKNSHPHRKREKKRGTRIDTKFNSVIFPLHKIRTSYLIFIFFCSVWTDKNDPSALFFY